MGLGASARRQQNVPFGPYGPSGNAFNPYYGGGMPLSRSEQRRLQKANQTIQELQMKMGPMQRIGGMGQPGSYSGPPIMNPPPPSSNMPQLSPYGGPPSSYRPPSPLFPPSPGQTSFPPLQSSSYPPRPPSPLLSQQQNPFSSQLPMQFSGGGGGGGGGFGGIGIRDSDYAAVANISGLNPADVALLHREYLNLTRGGTNKIDRVVFRQILRDAVVEANNEQIDRTIENIFLSIDRNHDGFIDFSEFVGAFRDVLRGVPYEQQRFSDLFNEQSRQNLMGSSSLSQPLSIFQQPQSSGQIIQIPSTGSLQQSPVVYNGQSPLVISLDSNQSPYTVQSQGQPLAAQPITLQCVPIPI